MYSLKESLTIMHGSLPFEGWDGRMYCVQANAYLALQTNKTNGFISAYTFTLVQEGWLTLQYNGRELKLLPNDLYIYSPGMEITVLGASEDYEGLCLLVDEHLTLETDTVRDMLRVAYWPIVRLHEPRIALSLDMATRLGKRMEEIASYLHSENALKGAIARYLFAVFLLDLQSAIERSTITEIVPRRTEEVFIGLMRLLPEHFAEHHDIPFYADSLAISTRYLSRVVQQMTGRTVMDYVNQFLMMEATFLLRTSDLSIGQISDQLHFSDQAAFCKFFTRLQGVSPKEYRQQK